MKIGLMADTHDNLEATEKAIELFNKENVSHVLHAGDLVSPFTGGKFEDLDAELHFVWGNNEGDKLHTRAVLEDIGIKPAGDFLSIEIDGKNIALLHGTDEEIVEALAGTKKFDAVVRGHTHEPEIKEDPLVINPGATSGYLTDSQTVAVLDTKRMKAEIIEL